MSELSAGERDDLARCEAVIERGLASFLEVGTAFLRIRESGLYRGTHATFDAYCRERWDMGRAHAYRLIGAAQVARNVSPIGDIPSTESQARPLTSLEPDQQREAWAHAVSTAPNGHPTADHVRRAVDELFPKDGPPSAATGPPPRPGPARSGLTTCGSATSTEKLKAPFPYFGGKSRVAGLIWDRLGDVDNYVEPFAGSAAVLLARPTAPRVETINDADCYVSNFWRATGKDPEAVAVHADWPVNEADLHARHRWLVLSDAARSFRERMRRDPEFYDAKIAGWWAWGACCWIGSGWCRVDEDIEDVDDKRPQLCVGNTSHGPGVRRKVPRPDGGVRREGEPSEKMPRLVGGRRGDEYYGGVGVHAEEHLAFSDGHRPQLADAFARGRGVHGNDSAEACAARREWLIGWFGELRDRLRVVRVCCGDWRRVCGSASVTTRLGVTGIFFDPPYSAEADRCNTLYGVESKTVAHDVRAYCLERGGDPKMRIVLAGYAGEGHEELVDKAGWAELPWKASGGYGNRSDKGKENAARERLWFSPHCIDPEKKRSPLFDGLD